MICLTKFFFHINKKLFCKKMTIPKPNIWRYIFSIKRAILQAFRGYSMVMKLHKNPFDGFRL